MTVDDRARWPIPLKPEPASATFQCRSCDLPKSLEDAAKPDALGMARCCACAEKAQAYRKTLRPDLSERSA